MRRYTPNPPEPVLGLIIERHAEGYRVDYGSSQAASLDALAFEGVTKRNKPNLKIGTLVYTHLLSTPPFSEPEISCVDPSTQEAVGLRELKGGMLIRGVELGV
ncbi:exosome non-catalytic core subunit rrp40 [Rhodosporidiobolus nylandii]